MIELSNGPRGEVGGQIGGVGKVGGWVAFDFVDVKIRVQIVARDIDLVGRVRAHRHWAAFADGTWDILCGVGEG